MENLTNPRNAIGDRVGPQSAWWRFPANAYLDHRHRNWVVAEELGDVIFVASAYVVLVHREHAQHIAEALLGGRDVVLLDHVIAVPARTPSKLVRLPAPSVVGHAREAARPVEIINARSRWRNILGWFGIVGGAAIFVAALALPLDDPALMVALALVVRGSGLIRGDAEPLATPLRVRDPGQRRASSSSARSGRAASG